MVHGFGIRIATGFGIGIAMGFGMGIAMGFGMGIVMGFNYPSVTLTRSFFTTWVGTPRGFLWTRNCVVTFGLAIAGFYLKNLSL